MKQELTREEKVLIEVVFKNPNINQVYLATKLYITTRKVRIRVNSIRKKGWITWVGVNHWLVADEKGYSLCRYDDERLKQWAHRFGSQAKDMNNILEVFNRVDLFNPIP